MNSVRIKDKNDNILSKISQKQTYVLVNYSLKVFEEHKK